MSDFLLYYQRPEPATWVYLSSFLTLGLYFVFHRFWSIRNLDILLLILLAPGILMVNEGRKRQILAETLAAGTAIVASTSGTEPAVIANAVEGAGSVLIATDLVPLDAPPVDAEFAPVPLENAGKKLELRGFVWLFIIEFMLLIRLFLDPLMVRRPLLDPNLTTGGLAFIGVSMLIFLMANVLMSTPRMQREQGPQLGPGYPVLNMLPALPTIPESSVAAMEKAAPMDGASPVAEPQVAYVALARTLAILAHVAVVLGITLIGHWHFGNFKAGAGCATLYLLLPYTAQMTGRVDHVLPAALLVWAVLMYRRPMIAGICLGTAAGLVYYPAFLLPLWLAFYRQRGLARFSVGVIGTIVFLTVLLSVGGREQFWERLIQMYGLWLPRSNDLEGVWGLGWNSIWRIPVLVGYVLLTGLYAIWPRQKNLGTLMSCSATLMVAAQFWHGFGGGLFIAWFLPLLLLTIFRPNLEDRVALKVLGGGNAARRPVTTGLDMDAA